MSSDVQQNLPATVHATPLEMPVAEMEGELVRLFLGKIPALNLEMEYGYARGAHLKIELNVRCRRYAADEIKAGPRKGELVREHIFDIESASIVGVYTQEEIDAADGAGVGGGLAAGVETEEDDDSDDRPDSEGADDEQGHDPFPDF